MNKKTTADALTAIKDVVDEFNSLINSSATHAALETAPPGFKEWMQQQFTDMVVNAAAAGGATAVSTDNAVDAANNLYRLCEVMRTLASRLDGQLDAIARKHGLAQSNKPVPGSATSQHVIH